MSNKELQQYVEDLIFKNEAIKEFEFLDGKLKVRISNLRAKDQIAVEEEMKTLTGTQALILHIYQTKLLSRTIKSYDNHEFKTPEEWYAFLENKGSIVLDLLMITQDKFEKELRSALIKPEVMENFTPPQSTGQEST